MTTTHGWNNKAPTGIHSNASYFLDVSLNICNVLTSDTSDMIIAIVLKRGDWNVHCDFVGHKQPVVSTVCCISEIFNQSL